jgi:hypothetical protein
MERAGGEWKERPVWRASGSLTLELNRLEPTAFLHRISRACSGCVNKQLRFLGLNSRELQGFVLVYNPRTHSTTK